MSADRLARRVAVDRVVRRDRLVEAGSSPAAILHAIRCERLWVPGPLVVSTVPVEELDDRGRYRAALEGFRGPVAASGAAALWRWSIREELDALVDVTVLAGRPDPRDGVQLHRSSTLRPQDLRRRDGLPLTSPPRALLDRAALVGPDDLEQDVAIAARRGLASADELRAQLAHVPTHPGAATLLAVLERGAQMTRGQAEPLLLRTLRDAVLGPSTNVRVDRWELDVAWPDARYAVEFDSQCFHEGWRAAEQDRAKDGALEPLGWLVARITWRMLLEPLALVTRIARVLEQRRAMFAAVARAA